MKKWAALLLSVIMMLGICVVPVSADAYDTAFRKLIDTSGWMYFGCWEEVFTEAQGPSDGYVQMFLGFSELFFDYYDDYEGAMVVPADEYEAVAFTYFKKSDRLLQAMRSGEGYNGRTYMLPGGIGGPGDEYVYTGYKSLGNNRYEVYATVRLSEIVHDKTGSIKHMMVVEYTGSGSPKILASGPRDKLKPTVVTTTTTTTTAAATSTEDAADADITTTPVKTDSEDDGDNEGAGEGVSPLVIVSVVAGVVALAAIGALVFVLVRQQNVNKKA